MKKFLLGTAALVALGVPAIAADMGVRPIARPAAPYSWTGCYLGVNVGYATGTTQQSAEPGSVLIGPGTVGPFGTAGTGIAAASPLPQAPFVFGQGADITPHYRLGGIMGGGTAGCQYQWTGPWGVWVFGIEGDGGPLDKQGQSNDQAPFNPQFVNQTNERWIATLRGRLGYVVDKWMFYATGGVAWARVEETAWDGCSVNASGIGGAVVSPGCGASIVGPFPAAAVATAAGVPSIHDRQTMVGYAVGAGAEYALGYGWSIKSEYIYINFKSKDFFGQGTGAVSCCAIPTFVSPTKVSLYDHTFKWGLNYKFDLGKAPVAVYK
ncbi:MAG: outer membrane beta-barrel protein [Xanthobacteraceae bacterium]|jgi:outer membrane immunogenic protein